MVSLSFFHDCFLSISIRLNRNLMESSTMVRNAHHLGTCRILVEVTLSVSGGTEPMLLPHNSTDCIEILIVLFAEMLLTG